LEAHFHVIVTSFVAKHTIQKKSHPVILGTIDTPIPIHETKSSRVAGITIEGKSRHGSHVIMRTAHLAQSKNWHVAFYLETSGKKNCKTLKIWQPSDWQISYVAFRQTSTLASIVYICGGIIPHAETPVTTGTEGIRDPKRS
jgi:hypothetical protein